MPYFYVRCRSPRMQRDAIERSMTALRPSPEEIARMAYSYWDARGRQGGSPEEDWFRAEREWHMANGG